MSTDMGPFPGPPGGYVGPPLPNAGYATDPPKFAYNVLPDLTPPDTPVIVQATPYHEYAITKVVFYKSGMYVHTPGGAVGTPGCAGRSEAPSGEMYVRWYSRSSIGPPKIPSAELSDNNAVYMDGWIALSSPGHLIDGTPCFVREGMYHYKLLLPYMETDEIVIAAAPYSDETASDHVLSPGDYQDDIIGPNQPPAAAEGLPPIDF